MSSSEFKQLWRFKKAGASADDAVMAGMGHRDQQPLELEAIWSGSGTDMGIASQLQASSLSDATSGLLAVPKTSLDTPHPSVWLQDMSYPNKLYARNTISPCNGANAEGIQHSAGLLQSLHRNFYSAAAVQNKLQTLVYQNGLQTFYSSQRIFELSRRVSQIDFTGLAERWKLPPQMVLDLVGLSLYDTVIMVDDSASMRIAENGERIEDMKIILERISSVCGLLDTDGISVCTMNGNYFSDHIRHSYEAADFVREISFEGATPLGTMINEKLLRPFIFAPAKRQILRKPVQIIVITDGEPTAEPHGQVRSAVAQCKNFLKSSTPYGAGAVAFQFAQVGLDEKAQAFLSKLDNDSKVGRMVDCTSAYELEQNEYLQKTGIHLTPDMYLNKLCLGAIDRSYDEQDENASRKKKASFFKRLLA